MGCRGASVVLRALITAASLPSKSTTYGPEDSAASDEGAQHVPAQTTRIGRGLDLAPIGAWQPQACAGNVGQALLHDGKRMWSRRRHGATA